MEFGVLGPLEAAEGDHRYSLGGPKQRAVLAMLIAAAGLPVEMGTLIEGLYGDDPPDRAHRSVHTFISNLRSELGEVIERRGEGYMFVGARSSIDACRFEDAMAEAALAEGPEQRIELLRSALSVWRGLPYSDVDAATMIAAESTRLNELRVIATEQRIDAELDAGRHALLIGELEALTVEYPLRENFWAQRMTALYRAGRQSEALRAFDRARSTLVDQSGLDPSETLRHLAQRILQQDPTLIEQARPTIRRVAILVADVADPLSLSRLSPLQRDRLIERQTRAVGSAVARSGGEVFAHRGTAMYATFAEVQGAVTAARDAQAELAVDDVLMRMAVSAGDIEVRSDGQIIGPPLARAASLAGAAHAGQVLLAPEAHQSIAEDGTAGWVIRSLGPHSFAGMTDPITVQQLVLEGLPDSFPPLQMSALPLAVPGANQGLPGYELREEVGSGVFGVAYRAYQPSVGREVAVKVIRPELANNPDFIRRFEVEAQLVARLEHPHIVPLHDYWRDTSGAYLVMRWVRGGSVADWLDEGPLDLFEINAVLAQIVPALDYAHRNGVVHRDLKPSNVLLDDDGNAYLTDFGIATDTSRDRPTAAAVDMRGIGHFIERCLAGGDISESIENYLEKIRTNGFADLVAMVGEWADVSGASAFAEEIGFTPTRNPYKGLSSFGEADARDFHGRADEIRQLVGALGERRLVAVVGPSGIGKSSVVRAGLIPALRNGALPGSERWLIADMLPGAQPFEELATALMRVATTSAGGLEDELRRDERGLVRAAKRYLPTGQTLVLVVDQFEELFTLVDNDELKGAFLELLGEAVADERANLRIVLTLRADFFDLPLRFGEFGDLLRRSTVPIAAPTEADLRAIITEPAAAVGVEFESGLVERLVADVKDQPGALPLLEFSLTELFGGRESDVIEMAGYEESAGVRGALGRRAELIYQELDPHAKEATRQVLLRLLTLPDAERVTRRRVRVAELHRLGYEAADVDVVVDAFMTHRLFTSDRDPITRGTTLEVAHEAIFVEWKRLAGWIEERRSDLRSRGRLLEATDDWEESGRQEALLLSGSRLDQLESWSKSTDLSVGDAERVLVVDSVAKREGDAEGRRRTRRRVLTGFAMAALVASIFGVFASVQRNNAAQVGDIARTRELAALAIAQLEVDPEQSVLLALESVELARSTGIESLEATTALRRSLAANRVVDRFEGGGFVAISPDGEMIVTGREDGAAVVRDFGSGTVIADLGRPDGTAIGAEFSPDGGKLAVVYAAAETPVWIWDGNFATYVRLDGPDSREVGAPASVSFDESGELVSAWLDNVDVWSVTSGELLDSLALSGYPKFVPGADLLIVADVVTGEVVRIDTQTFEEISRFSVPFPPYFPAISPDGSFFVAMAQAEQTVRAYDIATGAELWRTSLQRPLGAAWLANGELVAIGSDSGRISLLDGQTGDVVETLTGGHVGVVWALATVPGTQHLATSGSDDLTTIVWDVHPGPVAEIGRFDSGVQQARFVAYAPFPDQVFASDNEPPDSARVLSWDSGDVVVDVADPVVGVTGGAETVFVGDGSYVARLTTDGAAALLDARTGEVLYEPPEGMMVRNASFDGSRIVIMPTATGDPKLGQPQIVSVATGEVVAVLDTQSLWIPTFSYDGRWIYGGDGDEYAIFSTEDGRLAQSLAGLMTMRPMPDGHTISVVDEAGTLWHADLDMIMDGVSLEDAAIWSSFATQGFVVPLGHAASSDSALVGTTSTGGEPVMVWEASSGRQVASLDPELSSGVPYVFFHPDDPHVTVAGQGGTLLVYTLDTDELIEIAQERIQRSLTDAECQTFLHVDSCPG